MRKRFIKLLLLLMPIIVCAKPLSSDQIFQLNVNVMDANTLNIVWNIEDGFFLYKHAIKVINESSDILSLGPIRFPSSEKKINRQGIAHNIYRSKLALPIAILGSQSGESLIEVNYQGCSDTGICYPPQTKSIKLSIDQAMALNRAELDDVEFKTKSLPKTQITDRFARLFSTHNAWLISLSFFGFGLLLAFTPCVLPMIPVLSGMIVGQRKLISTNKAFFISLSYVLGMALTYSGIGALFALMGSNLQIIMQSPWVISLFSLLFFILALSMFDVYELKLPTSWNHTLSTLSRLKAGSRYLNAFVMGGLSSLILSPCVTAPLIGALTYMAQTGQVGLGSLALFFVGLGMGTPLLLIGTSFGKLLPKAGPWMNAIKASFGMMLIAIAIYLLQRILPPALSLILWAGLLIFAGIYIAKFKQTKLYKLIAVGLFTYALVLIIDSARFNTHHRPLLPNATIVTSVTEAKKALEHAKGTPIMVDFYANWCAECQLIAKNTLKDPKIVNKLTKFAIIIVDLSDTQHDINQLLAEFNVVAPPSFLFFDSSGHEIEPLRLTGEFSTTDLLDRLHSIR